jgi:site-specific recombinase XerD
MHDLRHSFASFLVNNGRNLYEVQRILGHSNIKTTERYAHLSQSSLLSAANEITKVVQSLGKEPMFSLTFEKENNY